MSYSSIYTYAPVVPTSLFSVPMPYLDKTHVQLRKNGVLLVVTTDYSWTTSASITLVASITSGDSLEMRRYTSPATRLVDFQNSARLDEATLDLDGLQGFYLAQEAVDAAALATLAANVSLTANQVSAAASAASAAASAASAVTAGTQAGNATTQVGLAAAQVALATTQAGNAATSATAASGSAVSAAASALAALTTLKGTARDLVSLEHVDVNTAHRDILKGAYQPGWFNQQWGGGVNGYELVDAATGTPYRFESATGYLEQTANVSVADVAGRTGDAMGFKVSKSDSYPAIWVKMYKIGNPTNNLELRIQADSGAGKPTANFTAITNGTATAISGKQFESGDDSGAWVRFVFATPCALVAGTQYHFTVKSSGAVDAANYWRGVVTTSNKYPHGYLNQADATPTWTSFTGQGMVFLVEAPATTATFQSGGIFGDGKAVFYEGSPLNQSNQRRADLADLKGLNMGSMTALFRGTAQTKDKTIADFTYGLDHDRVVVRCAVTTGFPVVTLYDSSGTARTVTGTTDISSGDHDVAIKVIANTGSGTDKLELWVDGVSQGTPITGVAITFDELFRQGQIGSLWIGGGFALAPTWSGSSISSFTGLPSTLGWAYAGAATEGSAYSVSGGVLSQNKSGFTALQDGSYGKTTAGLSNANGWTIDYGLLVASNTNTKDSGDCAVKVQDGSKVLWNVHQEYYQNNTAATRAYPQNDFKSAMTENIFSGKGSDAYAWVNGKLTWDATGLMTSASATNQIDFGDLETTSGENADARWKSMKYYTTAALLPQATAGSLSEWAIWTGDKTSILATLWNSGSPISVKQFCGLGVNWKRGDDGAWVHRLTQTGVTSSPTMGAATNTQVVDLAAFVLGDAITGSYSLAGNQNLGGTPTIGSMLFTDGVSHPPNQGPMSQYGYATVPTGANCNVTLTMAPNTKRTYFGLHKSEVWSRVDAGTVTFNSVMRQLNLEGRS